MKKIDTWLDIQRFLSGVESAERGRTTFPRENDEFVLVDMSEVMEGEGVRRVFYPVHI